MSDIHVHMFVVPVNTLGKLHELEKPVYEARQQDRPDRYCLSNQVFLYAKQVAVASVVLEHERYKDPASALWAYIEEQFRDGRESLVVDPDEFEIIRNELSVPRRDDLLLWADVNTPGAGNVDRIYLLEVHAAVVEMMRSVPPGPHGLVYGYFFADELEPPPPPEPKQWRGLSREDTEHFKRSMAQRSQQWWARQEYDSWPEEEGTEGRYLLGLLAPERATALRQAYLAAWQAIQDHGHTLGYPRMQELISQLERELVRPVILTRADRVRAHECLGTLTGWNTPSDRRSVATADMAAELGQRLDALEQQHGGVDGLVEHVWREERHWRRDAVRETYAQVRDLIGRAMDRGHGFAWFLDRDW